MLEVAEKFEKAFERMDECDIGYKQYFFQDDEPPMYDEEDERSRATLSSTKKRVRVPPESEDWDRARLFIQFLEIYYKTTNKIFGSMYVTADLLFNELVMIHINLKKLCGSLDKGLHQMGTRMYENFEKYWSFNKINPILLVAVVLDPRFKIGFFSFSLKKVYGDDDPRVSTIVEKVKDTLQMLYDWYVMKRKSSSSASSSQNELRVSKDVSNDDVVDIASEWKKHYKSGSHGNMTELEKYLNYPPEDEGEDFHILDWWKTNAAKYPTLSLVARDVLAIPVTSVASESVFSTEGRILDAFRTSLRPYTVEALICTQNWLQLGKPIDLQVSMQEIEQYDEIDAEIFESTTSSLPSDAQLD